MKTIRFNLDELIKKIPARYSPNIYLLNNDEKRRLSLQTADSYASIYEDEIIDVHENEAAINIYGRCYSISVYKGCNMLSVDLFNTNF